MVIPSSKEELLLEIYEKMKLEKIDCKNDKAYYYFKFRDIQKCVILSKHRFWHEETSYPIAWNIAQEWYCKLGEEQGWINI
jgi:hypothetical protein